MYFLFNFWYPLSLEKILIVYFNKLEFPLPSGTEEDKMWTVCKQTCGRTDDWKQAIWKAHVSLKRFNHPDFLRTSCHPCCRLRFTVNIYIMFLVVCTYYVLYTNITISFYILFKTDYYRKRKILPSRMVSFPLVAFFSFTRFRKKPRKNIFPKCLGMVHNDLP